MGGLLVAAQIEKFITVSHNALPLFFKKGLELSEVLDDDAHGDLSAPHGGKQLVEFIRQGNIRKLVHNEMHMDRQPAAVYHIRLIVELLEQLGIEHPHNKVKTGVIVGDHGKNGRLFLTQTPQFHLVCLRHAGQRFQIELLQPRHQCDLDGFQGLAAAGAVITVVFQGNVLRVLHFQAVKEFIQRGSVGVVVLPNLAGPDHLHHHGEVLFLLWGLVVEVEHQRQQEHLRRLIPEGVL